MIILIEIHIIARCPQVQVHLFFFFCHHNYHGCRIMKRLRIVKCGWKKKNIDKWQFSHVYNNCDDASALDTLITYVPSTVYKTKKKCILSSGTQRANKVLECRMRTYTIVVWTIWVKLNVVFSKITSLMRWIDWNYKFIFDENHNIFFEWLYNLNKKK